MLWVDKKNYKVWSELLTTPWSKLHVALSHLRGFVDMKVQPKIRFFLEGQLRVRF